jgi:hypothetical protein
VRTERGSDVIIFLVGNKTDLLDKRCGGKLGGSWGVAAGAGGLSGGVCRGVLGVRGGWGRAGVCVGEGYAAGAEGLGTGGPGVGVPRRALTCRPRGRAAGGPRRPTPRPRAHPPLPLRRTRPRRQVSLEEGDAKARELAVNFIETSAKAGFNIKARGAAPPWVRGAATAGREGPGSEPGRRALPGAQDGPPSRPRFPEALAAAC